MRINRTASVWAIDSIDAVERFPRRPNVVGQHFSREWNADRRGKMANFRNGFRSAEQIAGDLILMKENLV